MQKNSQELYIMFNNTIEASPSGENFIDVYYLNRRIAEQAKMITPALNIEIAKKLEKVKTFVELVEYINIKITALAINQTSQMAQFALQIGDGKGYRNKWLADVPTYGEAVKIFIGDEVDENDIDAFLASFQVKFPHYMLANISVSFGLRKCLPISPITPDLLIDFTSSAYQNMIKRSLTNLGNLARLKRAINKAKAGEDVTIAYIGGSITQGAGAKPINSMCYAKKSCEMFKKHFAKNSDKVHFIKAGIGGTPSQLGIARYHRDILAPENGNPDIVIIEFAVNDFDDETKGVCYESLCLMAYEGPGNPAVILLFSVFANDESLEWRLGKVGHHYGFPMVSPNIAVTTEYAEENPIISRRHYYHDILHPSNVGHQVMADCLDYLWKTAESVPPVKEENLPDTPIIGDRYKNLKTMTRKDIMEHEAVSYFAYGGFTEYDTVLQSVERNDDVFTTPQFTDNWHYKDKTADGFKMSIECRDLLLLYKDSDAVHFAPVDIIIDGIHVRTLDPNAVGWNHCGATFIINSDEKKSHTIEIKPKTTETKSAFTILGFGYTN